VWKIDLALKGLADDALLDTYEIERKTVAEFNGAQSLENTRRMEETGWPLFNPDAIAKIEAPGPEGQAIRDRIAEAVPRQREQFYSFGQQFGSIYRSAAVIPDGSDPEPSTVSDYRITAHPGVRAPHLWLCGPDGRDLSTIDLFYDGFVVLAGPQGGALARCGQRHRGGKQRPAEGLCHRRRRRSRRASRRALFHDRLRDRRGWCGAGPSRRPCRLQIEKRPWRRACSPRGARPFAIARGAGRRRKTGGPQENWLSEARREHAYDE
jgi:hypothetical protein